MCNIISSIIEADMANSFQLSQAFDMHHRISYWIFHIKHKTMRDVLQETKRPQKVVVMQMISLRARRMEKNMVTLKSSLKKISLKLKIPAVGKKDGCCHKRRRKSEFLRYEREWLEDTTEMSSLKKFPDDAETSEMCASEQERTRKE